MVKFTFAGTLTFQFGMRNMINEPFGITNFALGNLVIGADIDFKQASITIGKTISKLCKSDVFIY